MSANLWGGVYMKVTIDKEAWERGVRDGFAGERHQDVDEYSYWSGWIEGDAAHRGNETSVRVAQICGVGPSCRKFISSAGKPAPRCISGSSRYTTELRKFEAELLRFETSLWRFLDLLRATLRVDSRSKSIMPLAISMIDAFEITAKRDLKAFPVNHFQRDQKADTISDNGATM